jgi:hypothetical protein
MPRALIRAGATAAAAIAAVMREGEAQAEVSRLLVFLHVAFKQHAFEATLQAALPGITVTAVGRIADFERSLNDTPVAVLTLPVVLEAQMLSIQLQGFRNGSREEKYALVAADNAPDPAAISSVGALDILGREGTTAFVHRMLQSRPKVERVTKVEDLLPLLQMQRVEAIFLPLRLIPDVQASSRLRLAPRELGTVGLPALALRGGGGTQIVSAVARLPGEIMRVIGVEEWR